MMQTCSEQLSELFSALAKAQGMMSPATKDSVNPHFKSAYADLDSVMSALRLPLSSNGLAIFHSATTDGAQVTVRTFLAHSSGQFISFSLTATAKSSDPQAIGSAITYLRRYGAMAITGLAPSDDDGNAATGDKRHHSHDEAHDRNQTARSFAGVFDPDDPNDRAWLKSEFVRRNIQPGLEQENWEKIGRAMSARPRTDVNRVIAEVLAP